ncbi:MAG: hypothetical protein RLZZ246_2134, partial [Planctomycetota bacterium]
ACELSSARLQSIGAQADVVLDDVLTWRPPTPVDAVYEQTCLCALHPRHWRAYVASLAAWLRPGGVLLAMLAQRPRPGAVAEGLIEGPPYHTDIHAARALFDDDAWQWPAPPYPRVDHPNGMHELGLLIRRR